MNNEYKLKQLQGMLDAEEGNLGAKIGGYGANLTHWAGHGISPINLDADALRVLIAYYGGIVDQAEQRKQNLAKMAELVEDIHALLDELDESYNEVMNSGAYQYGGHDKTSNILRAVDGLVCAGRYNVQSCRDEMGDVNK